jgi:excisionase family DNA binding protein
MVDENQQSRLLTVRQTSRLLNVHPNTVRRWSDQGIIKSYRIGPRGDRRFKWEDINRLLVGKAEDKGTGASRSTFDSESTLEIT